LFNFVRFFFFFVVLLLREVFIGGVYDISPGTIIRVVCESLFMKGLRFFTLKQDEHGDLRGSNCRSVIPYIHEDSCYITVFVLQASVELARMDLSEPV
jgi:hypothetical protein